MTELKDKLRNIALLTPGETLMDDFTVVPHGTWTTCFWRTLYSQSRHTMIYELYNLLGEIEIYLNQYKSDLEMIKLIQEAKKGINNLKQTYKDDNGVCNDLDLIIKQLDSIVVHAQVKNLFDTQGGYNTTPLLLQYLKKK